MQFQLEKYHGTKSRFTCPNCGAKNSFVRYQNERGEYIAADVGRCNRESNCGYHRKPKEFFIDNPTFDQPKPTTRRKPIVYGFAEPQKIEVQKPIDYIAPEILKRTLTNYENNSFVQFLFNLFPDCKAEVWRAIKNYRVGTTKTGKTIFWQIDEENRIRTGKIIAYNAQTGKRSKEVFPNWTHSELIKAGTIEKDFNLSQCFFGEHLLPGNQKTVCITEAEKTAVICSICYPENVWIATGAKQNFKAEKLKKFHGRKIMIYPDADAFDLWAKEAAEARKTGISINVSELVEKRATDEEKRGGFDLADYLINESIEINEFNNYADDYNAALDKILQS